MPSAVISPCGLYRYRLERDQIEPITGVTSALQSQVVGFFGVNPSTADANVDDHTVRKWIGFCRRWAVPRFVVGNAFAYRATDVASLAGAEDPFGPDIGEHTTRIIEDVDILVPCWGDTSKVPPRLQFAFDVLLDALMSSGKPVLCFGTTRRGDPAHPLMLPYSCPLRPVQGSLL